MTEKRSEKPEEKSVDCLYTLGRRGENYDKGLWPDRERKGEEQVHFPWTGKEFEDMPRAREHRGRLSNSYHCIRRSVKWIEEKKGWKGDLWSIEWGEELRKGERML